MKTNVKIYNNQSKIEISNDIKKLMRKACRQTLAFEGFNHDASVDITVVDNSEIKEINKENRNIDKETDVLSFPLSFNGDYETDYSNGSYLLGDIVISAEKAVEQANTYGHSVSREFAFLTVHSMLHLLGYDHVNNKEEEKEMFQKQEEILIKMGQGIKK
ncbi:MAG: rRNA maturation RNase YbeY [Clostridia bacterium]|nr:rRNA maturation RNase YbeY [Clostridia bacterium]